MPFIISKSSFIVIIISILAAIFFLCSNLNEEKTMQVYEVFGMQTKIQSITLYRHAEIPEINDTTEKATLKNVGPLEAFVSIFADSKKIDYIAFPSSIVVYSAMPKPIYNKFSIHQSKSKYNTFI